MKVLAIVAAAWAALWPGAGHACGACREDTIAAAYDHAVVQRAAARGEVVVFCAVAGPVQAARLKAAAMGVRGVRPHSVRVSTQPGALSFAIDPAQQSPQAAVDALQQRLAAGTQLSIVRLLVTARPERDRALAHRPLSLRRAR